MTFLESLIGGLLSYGLATISFFVIIIGGWKYLNGIINKIIVNKVMKVIFQILAVILVVLLFAVFLGSLDYFFGIKSI